MDEGEDAAMDYSMFFKATNQAASPTADLAYDDGSIPPADDPPVGDDIVVYGTRLPTNDVCEIFATSYGDDTASIVAGEGEGSNVISSKQVAVHTPDCSSANGAAVQVATHVLGTLPPGFEGPPSPLQTGTGRDHSEVEFAAVIVRNAEGSFSALNDAIYSNDLRHGAALPNGAGAAVQGIWHNHPALIDGFVDRTQQALDRYPSPRDWVTLQTISKQVGANPDPSIWVTDFQGVTREFKFSERETIEKLERDQQEKGVGLAGRERSRSCGG